LARATDADLPGAARVAALAAITWIVLKVGAGAGAYRRSGGADAAAGNADLIGSAGVATGATILGIIGRINAARDGADFFSLTGVGLRRTRR
jgi:hypothetical protein